MYKSTVSCQNTDPGVQICGFSAKFTLDKLSVLCYNNTVSC